MPLYPAVPLVFLTTYAVLFLAPATVSLLSVQWGNNIWPMVVIWTLGSVIVWRVGRLHISATYVASFLLLSLVRSSITGTPWLASVAPITGPMYQLFIFFMVTDPKTTVRSTAAERFRSRPTRRERSFRPRCCA